MAKTAEEILAELRSRLSPREEDTVVTYGSLILYVATQQSFISELLERVEVLEKLLLAKSAKQN